MMTINNRTVHDGARVISAMIRGCTADRARRFISRVAKCFRSKCVENQFSGEVS
jgi:hypothetical protein